MANQITIGKTSFAIGDTVRVWQKIKEEAKVRTQAFEGVVIAIKGRGENKMFTVRKIAVGGVGVERIWPVASPWLEKIVVKKKGEVKKAKLYYLRKKLGRKAIKVRVKQMAVEKDGKKGSRKTGRTVRRPISSKK